MLNIKQIQELLNCDEDRARAIEELMGSIIDFSECSQEEFNTTAIACDQFVDLV